MTQVLGGENLSDMLLVRINVEVAVESFGINWLQLLSQIAVACLAIPVFIVLASFLVQTKKQSKNFVISIGLLTAWATFFFVVFGLSWVFVFIVNIANPYASFETAFTFYKSIQFLGMVTVLLSALLITYYISHAAKSPFLSGAERTHYQVGLLFLPLIFMPLYYWKFVMKDGAIRDV